MRKRHGVIFTIIGYIVFFFCMEGWGADWKSYGKTKTETLFYDAESVRELSPGVIRVWGEAFFRPKG